MAEELRLALSLLGSLAVGAVVLHGIWTVRKNSLEERKQAELDKEEEPEIDEEEQETQALRIKQMEIDFSELGDSEQAGGLPLGDVNVDSIYKNDQKTGVSSAVLDETETRESTQAENPNQGQLYDQLHTDTNNSQPVFESGSDLTNKNEKGMGEFLSHAREVTSKATAEDDNEPFIESFSALGDIRDERIEPSVSIDDESVLLDNNSQRQGGSEPQSPSQSGSQSNSPQQAPASETSEKAPEVLILFVDKPDGEMIEGAKLLPLLLTLGFKFGEMDFFHRHEQSSGHGEVLFSLANMYNPGTFDIDHMEQVATRGLSIFMTLPNAGEPLQTFNMMHNAAKKIADEFGAQVLDAERQPLDVVRVRNYVDKIRKY